MVSESTLTTTSFFAELRGSLLTSFSSPPDLALVGSGGVVEGGVTGITTFTGVEGSLRGGGGEVGGGGGLFSLSL